MGAFQDKPHSNPLLSKHQLAALRQQQAEEAEEQEEEHRALEEQREAALLKRQRQAQEQRELQRVYTEKAAQRRAQEEREQAEQQRLAASSRRQQPAEEPAQPKPATHRHVQPRADQQQTQTARTSPKQPAQPEDEHTRMAKRARVLSQGLAAEAVALKRMLREGGPRHPCVGLAEQSQRLTQRVRDPRRRRSGQRGGGRAGSAGTANTLNAQCAAARSKAFPAALYRFPVRFALGERERL